MSANITRIPPPPPCLRPLSCFELVQELNPVGNLRKVIWIGTHRTSELSKTESTFLDAKSGWNQMDRQKWRIICWCHCRDVTCRVDMQLRRRAPQSVEPSGGSTTAPRKRPAPAQHCGNDLAHHDQSTQQVSWCHDSCSQIWHVYLSSSDRYLCNKFIVRYFRRDDRKDGCECERTNTETILIEVVLFETWSSCCFAHWMMIKHDKHEARQLFSLSQA